MRNRRNLQRRKLHKAKRLFAALFAGLILLAAAGCKLCLPVQAQSSVYMASLDAEETGTLTVVMQYTENGVVRVFCGVEIALRQVAELSVSDGEAQYTLLDTYADTGIDLSDMTASESCAAAAALLAASTGEADYEAATGTDGTVTFSGLSTGMYLVYQTENADAANSAVNITPFLVSVPEAEVGVETVEGSADSTDGSSSTGSWNYTVTAYPKMELTTEEEDTGDTGETDDSSDEEDAEEETDGSADEEDEEDTDTEDSAAGTTSDTQDGSGSSDGTTGSSSGSTSFLKKTGDDTRADLWISLLGLALCVITATVMRREAEAGQKIKPRRKK